MRESRNLDLKKDLEAVERGGGCAGHGSRHGTGNHVLETKKAALFQHKSTQSMQTPMAAWAQRFKSRTFMIFLSPHHFHHQMATLPQSARATSLMLSGME